MRGEVNRILRAPLSCRTAKRRENRDAPVARGNISLACSNGGSDHPGSMLSFASGSAIKRITAGVKARR